MLNWVMLNWSVWLAEQPFVCCWLYCSGGAGATAEISLPLPRVL